LAGLKASQYRVQSDTTLAPVIPVRDPARWNNRPSILSGHSTGRPGAVALWAGTGRPAATGRSGFPFQGVPAILIRRAGVPHWNRTVWPTSTSREPPATASAAQPMSGTWPVPRATAAARAPPAFTSPDYAAIAGWPSVGFAGRSGPRHHLHQRYSLLVILGACRTAAVRHLSPRQATRSWPRRRLPSADGTPEIHAGLLAHPSVDAFPQQVGVAGHKSFCGADGTFRPP
jgi:hypothetical protein